MKPILESSLTLIMLAVLALGCGLANARKSYDITYRVTSGGDIASADITIATPGGGSEQHVIYAPYTGPVYKFGYFDHAYISAQVHKGSSITVEILSDGKVVKTATSTGEHSIATVSWSVGSSN